MSINAQKRLLIIMGSTGDRDADMSRVASARALTEALRDRFPNRSYNFGTVVVYLERLRARCMVSVVHQAGELRYRLTAAGYDEARKLWDERDSLGYIEPTERQTLAAAAGILATTHQGFAVAPV